MSIMNPPKETRGTVLGDGHPRFILGNGHIGVFEKGGGQKNGAAGRKANNKPQIPEDKVPALVRIVWPGVVDCTVALDEVQMVAVPPSERFGAEVEVHSGKD